MLGSDGELKISLIKVKLTELTPLCFFFVDTLSLALKVLTFLLVAQVPPFLLVAWVLPLPLDVPLVLPLLDIIFL
jgi:hypothetical protein